MIEHHLGSLGLKCARCVCVWSWAVRGVDGDRWGWAPKADLVSGLIALLRVGVFGKGLWAAALPSTSPPLHLFVHFKKKRKKRTLVHSPCASAASDYALLFLFKIGQHSGMDRQRVNNKPQHWWCLTQQHNIFGVKLMSESHWCLHWPKT